MRFMAMGKRLKSLRERKGWSLRQLAESTGLEESGLQLFEDEKDVPRIAELIKISKSLDVNVADIFRERPFEKEFEIVRSTDREKKSPLMNPSEGPIKEYFYEPLTVASDNKHMDAYLIELPPKQGERPQTDQTHPGEEFIYVLEGTISGKINGESFELMPGDSIYLRSGAPHIFYNAGDKFARALTVIYPY